MKPSPGRVLCCVGLGFDRRTRLQGRGAGPAPSPAVYPRRMRRHIRRPLVTAVCLVSALSAAAGCSSDQALVYTECSLGASALEDIADGLRSGLSTDELAQGRGGTPPIPEPCVSLVQALDTYPNAQLTYTLVGRRGATSQRVSGAALNAPTPPEPSQVPSVERSLRCMRLYSSSYLYSVCRDGLIP